MIMEQAVFLFLVRRIFSLRILKLTLGVGGVAERTNSE